LKIDSIKRAVFLLAVAFLLLFLAVPLAAIILRALPFNAEGWLGERTFDALRLSLVTASISRIFSRAKIFRAKRSPTH